MNLPPTTGVSANHFLDLMMREYEAMRAEQRLHAENYDRLVAFLGLATAGALAFVAQSGRLEGLIVFPLVFETLAMQLFRNMTSRNSLGLYLQALAERINQEAGHRVTGWEQIGGGNVRRGPFILLDSMLIVSAAAIVLAAAFGGAYLILSGDRFSAPVERTLTGLYLIFLVLTPPIIFWLFFFARRDAWLRDADRDYRDYWGIPTAH